MACNVNRLNYYVTKINNFLDLREKLDTAFENAMLTGEVKSYTFDSGEGRQTTSYRSLQELQDAMDFLDSRIDWYMRKASSGGGLVSVNQRRKSYYYSYCGGVC